MLFDVDKHSLDRSTPSPNRPDVLPPATSAAHGTHSVNYVTDASSSNSVLAKNGQFTIVQVGNYTSPAPGIWTPVDKTVFSNTTFTLGTIPHGLGYKPGIIAYYNEGNIADLPLPYDESFGGAPAPTAPTWNRLWCSVDATNVSFFLSLIAINTPSWNFESGFSFTYYLTQQTASDQ